MTAESIDRARQRIAEQLRGLRPSSLLIVVLRWDLSVALAADDHDAADAALHRLAGIFYVLGATPN